MVKAVFVFVLLGLVAVHSVSAEDLKCYICKDCETAAGDAKACSKDNFDHLPSSPPTVTSTTGNTARAGSTTAAPTTAAPTTAVPTGEYECFTYTYKDKDKTKIDRGCTYTDCKAIAEAKNATCETCKEDGCNPAANIKSWALSIVILVAIIKMFV